MVKHSSHTLDRIFSALSDPTRRAILEHLAERERPVTELANPHKMSLPAISKHLRVLEEAGLIVRSKDGRYRRCSLNSEPLKAASAWLERYRHFWETRFDALDDLLESSKKEKP
jgi:DNA-binding transcriptional ArsR family regulator